MKVKKWPDSLPVEMARVGLDLCAPFSTKWYNDHPAFKGLTVNEWCKRLTSNTRDSPGQRSYAFRFCFECTPKPSAAI